MKFAPALPLTVLLLSTALSAQAATPAALERSAAALANEHWIAAVHLSKAALAEATLTPADKVKALNNLCVAETKVGSYAVALDACSQAIALIPQWGTYLNRGNLFAMMGKAGAARADYAEAKALNPANAAVAQGDAVKLGFGTVKTASFIAYLGGETPAHSATGE